MKETVFATDKAESGTRVSGERQRRGACLPGSFFVLSAIQNGLFIPILLC